jgi:hypothetical protein
MTCGILPLPGKVGDFTKFTRLKDFFWRGAQRFLKDELVCVVASRIESRKLT